MTDLKARGQDTRYELRINTTLLMALDDYCALHGISRAEGFRRAIVALTGAMPVPRKKRDNGLGEFDPDENPCPAHGLTFNACMSHSDDCEGCECLMHRD